MNTNKITDEVIDFKVDDGILRFDKGGCRPATGPEKAMWSELQRQREHHVSEAVNIKRLPLGARFKMMTGDDVYVLLDRNGYGLVAACADGKLDFPSQGIFSLAGSEDGMDNLMVFPVISMPQPVSNDIMECPVKITADEFAAFNRFCDTAEDDASYDVPSEMMKRLAEIGLVRRCHSDVYEQTQFGLSVRTGKYIVPSATVDWQSQELASQHATALEQCAIFAADVGSSIAKSMTDAAAFLRTLSNKQSLSNNGSNVDAGDGDNESNPQNEKSVRGPSF